jgi:hypothetical protein
MVDIRSMSDEELKRLYASRKALSGMSDEQLKETYRQQTGRHPATPAAPGLGVGGTIDDVLKSLGSGAITGAHTAIGGGIGDLEVGLPQGANWFGNKIRGAFGAEPLPAPDTSKHIFATTPEMEAKTGFAAHRYEPKTVAGAIAGTGGEFATGGAVGGAASGIIKGTRVAERIMDGLVKFGLVPGMTSEVAGQAAKGTEYETMARVAGGLVGGTLPAVTRRVATPINVRPHERVDAANILQTEAGMTGEAGLTAGQFSGNRRRLAAEQTLGGDQGRLIEDAQGRAFTRAAGQEAGINADSLMPDALRGNYERLGRQVEGLSARNTLTPDPQMATDIRTTLSDYARLVEPPNRTPAIAGYATEIANHLQRNQGILPGPEYQSLRSRIQADARSLRQSNPTAARTLGDLADDLDDAMERSITANNPQDLGAWQQFRQQYRNHLTLEKAMERTGEETAKGQISPSNLHSSTAITQGRRNYVNENSQLSRLARAGEQIMPRVANSGTPVRMTSANPIMQALSIAPRAYQSVALRPGVRRYLTNQALPKGEPDKLGAAIAQGANLDRNETSLSKRARTALGSPESSTFSKFDIELLNAVIKGTAGRDTKRYVEQLLNGSGPSPTH